MTKFLAPISLATSLASLALVSQFSFATGMSASDAGTLEAVQTKKMVCEVSILDKDQQETSVFKGEMLLKEDGETLETPVGSYSVLIQYYLSKAQEDGLANERIEVAINSERQQEDYINSSAKPIVFLSSLAGLIPATGQEFIGILIDCTPSRK